VLFVRSTSASIASHPAFLTLRNAPRLEQDGARYGFDLGKTRSNIFLQIEMDRGIADLPVTQTARVHPSQEAA
jgi:hypothetical protein